MSNKHIRFDWAIKRLLRQKSNFGILEGFLSELLKHDVAIEDILESEGNKEDELDKFNRVDILAKLDGGELVIIEVQNEREHDYFHRMNYAQAKLISQHIHESSKYREVKRIISVNIVYFKLGHGLDYVYEGRTQFRGMHQNDILELNSTQRKMFPNIDKVSDIFAQYYIIKVNTFDDIAKDTLDEWIYFLKNSDIKDNFKAKGIQEANEKMRKDNLKGGERIEYDIFVKEQRIKESEIESVLFDAQLKIEDVQLKLEEAQLKYEAEQLKLEEAQLKYEAEQKQTLEEKAKALALAEQERAEKNKLLSKQAASVLKLHAKGMAEEDIADALEISAEQVHTILDDTKE